MEQNIAKQNVTKQDISKMKVMMYRLCQVLTGSVLSVFHMPVPALIEGENSILQLPELLLKKRVKKVCIMTTAGMVRRGTLQPLLEQLDLADIAYVINDDVQPDPTIACIETAADLYRNEACEAILAIGGGSVMDCAKVAAARVARPGKSVQQMTGMFKVRRRLPTIYAVPTTAGTGSEVTVAAVITDEQTHYKYPVEDLCLIPKVAILDPALTAGLPQALTATTGMDALTHAVEAYTNRYGSKRARRYAVDAIRLIMNNLLTAYKDGFNMAARAGMLKGSCYAGIAFTNAFVGYVHAIAHAVGGIYHVPHGLANAVILPIVLEAYGESAYDSLAQLAEVAGITEEFENNETSECTEASQSEKTSKKQHMSKEKAKAFIRLIRTRNQEMDIPSTLSEIQEADIPEIVHRAMREANPAYPVPQIWGEERFAEVVRKIAGL